MTHAFLSACSQLGMLAEPGRRLEHGDLEIEASLGTIARPCLKNKTKPNQTPALSGNNLISLTIITLRTKFPTPETWRGHTHFSSKLWHWEPQRGFQAPRGGAWGSYLIAVSLEHTPAGKGEEPRAPAASRGSDRKGGPLEESCVGSLNQRP